MPSFWADGCPTTVHKGDETSRCSSSPIPGRSFVNESIQGLQLDMAMAQYLLENLGFVINLEKSCFTPTQTLEFLVNTWDMTLHLPDYKVEAIKADCNNLIAHHKV